MDTDVGPASPAEAEWLAAQRKWAHGWRLSVLRAVPLVYLIYVTGAVGQYSRGAGAVAGYAVLAAFGVVWLIPSLLPLAPGGEAFPANMTASGRFWAWYGVLAALFMAELPFARAPAFVMCVFIAMITVTRLGRRSAPVVLALALAALLVPVAIPSWHVSLSSSFGAVTPVAIPIVAL